MSAYPQKGTWISQCIGAQDREQRILATSDQPIRDYFQKAGRVFSEKPGNEHEFSNARAFANPFHATLWRHALTLFAVTSQIAPASAT